MQRYSYTSVQPKSVLYRTNGSGRDTYISTNNGGNFRINTAVCDKSATSLYSSKLSTPVLPVPKSIRYRTDGTGRDTYISISDGGLHAATLPNTSKNSFIYTLRSYTRPASGVNLSRDQSKSMTVTVNKRSLSNLRERSRVVKDCINRLSRPKLQKERYEDISYT